MLNTTKQRNSTQEQNKQEQNNQGELTPGYKGTTMLHNNVVKVNQSTELISVLPDEEELFSTLGTIYGTCYCSDTLDKDRNKRRVLNGIKRGHLSPLEHISITLKIVIDRASAFALVRHRHCAFTQQSTIYTKYKELQVIDLPEEDCYFSGYKYRPMNEELIDEIAKSYFEKLEQGTPAGIARDDLPNCLATTLYMTTNLREWFYILWLRKDPADSPRIHLFIKQLDTLLKSRLPELYRAFADAHTCNCKQ